jgi:hypothetical protein
MKPLDWFAPPASPQKVTFSTVKLVCISKTTVLFSRIILMWLRWKKIMLFRPRYRFGTMTKFVKAIETKKYVKHGGMDWVSNTGMGR